MHSKQPKYGQRQLHCDRDRKWRDDYNDRQEDRHEYCRDVQWDSYHSHFQTGPGRTERSNRSTDYRDPPQKLYSKDSPVRDGDTGSPARGRLSSPDRRVAEKKRRWFTGDSRDDSSYRCEPDGKKYRRLPDSFSKDFKHQLTQEVDFKYRPSMQDSQSRHRREVSTSRYHQAYNSSHRQPSTYNKERDDHERNHSYSLERKLSREDSKKRHIRSRERKNSSPTDPIDHRQNQARDLDESKRQSFEHVTKPSQDVPEKKNSNGFQRFLDVLNKGVDVDMLNQIVIQNPADDCGKSPPAALSHNVVDHSYIPGEQVGQQNVNKCNEENFGEERHRLHFPQHCLESISPIRRSPYDATSVQRSDETQGCMGSGIPPVVEKKSLAPEDEHKHQQIQEVLQAIGVDLGPEELGQMSHRINERLYGKRGSDCSYQSTERRERITRSAHSSRRRSRSSSSSSSSASRSKPSCNDSSVCRDSYGAQSNFKVEQVRVPNNSRSLLDHQKCETQATAFPNTPTTLRPTMLTMPAYGSVNRPPMVYPPQVPNISNLGPKFVFPPPPACLPHQPSMLPLPSCPPFMPYPYPYPRPFSLNMLPSVLAQTRHLLPPPVNNMPPPFINPSNVQIPLPSIVDTIKCRTLSRPRCLLLIDTKPHR
ncbi:uncharacterized protein LOC133151352 isoform X3 [Syngnathus typhle]|uniref:uncharacterized protein LOC133151352 isoform X3 n=1 Tax=Syngnathus typhle TaxID=161592 RepID=UPI002A69C80E|nr:uncharacterized protein LOC133151352 isoform X3 [Syngnathus typhle]